MRAHSSQVSALARLIRERTDDCADRAVRRVHAALPQSVLSGDPQVRPDLKRVVELSLELVDERRPPMKAELAWCSDLGVRRARQGVSLAELVRFVHTGQLVMWELLAELAQEAGTDVAAQLVAHAAQLWSDFDLLSSAAGEGHADATARLSVEARARAVRFLDAVERYPDRQEAAVELARANGFDPHGPFLVAVHAGVHAPVDVGAPIIVVEDSTCTTVVVQPHLNADKAESQLIEAVLAGELSPVGVGLQRSGIAGAQLSLADARLAYDAACRTDAPGLRFRECWLEALAVAHIEDHAALVDDAVARIRSEVGVRGTLAAYLQECGSLTATGRALGLHPNTVAYRLRQFAARTGVDPRTPGGAALTQVALTLALAEGPEVGPPLAAG